MWAALAAMLSITACATEAEDTTEVEGHAVTGTSVVSPTVARAIAETYQVAEGGAVRTVRTSSTMLDRGGRPAMYAFNFNEGGFVVLAADFSVAPVLAFADEGMIDLANLLPGGQDEWAADMRSMIEAVRARSAGDSAARKAMIDQDLAEREAWTPLLAQITSRAEVDPTELARAKQVVEADICFECPPPPELCTSYATKEVKSLLKTQWNQGCEFNQDVTTAGAYCGRAPTGCGPTAMSQVVFHHKKASGRYFNWDMPLTAYGTSQQMENRAALMRDTGVSASASYGFYATGVTVPNLRNALGSYGYATATGSLPYGPGNVAIPELDAKRPMLMFGWSSSVGHAWVVDGYRRKVGSPLGCKPTAASTIKYFSYNWGWGGPSAFYKEGDYAGYNGSKQYLTARP